MHNELIQIGPFTIYGYGLMIAIGILAAYITAEYRSKKLGLDSEKIFGLVIACVVSGFAGSKILYTITILPSVLENPSILLDFADGWVVYGGIIGGILGGVLYCRVRKLDFIRYFDMTMPSVALAQGFGRIGCLLAGCCYGIESEGVLSITFHESAYAPNDVALVPTEIYSSILNFLNFFILVLIAKKFTDRRGTVAGCYLIFYSIGRFVIEFFRGDLIRGAVGPLSTSQFIAIFVCLAGVIMVLRAKWDTGGNTHDSVSTEHI